MFHILCVRGEKLMKENTETEISVNSNSGYTEQITCLSFPRLLTRTYQRSISIWVSCPPFLIESIHENIFIDLYLPFCLILIPVLRPCRWRNTAQLVGTMTLAGICDDNSSNIVFKVDYPSASAGRSGRYN